MSEQMLEKKNRAQKSDVAIYLTHGEAESAVRELKKSNFDIRQLSMIGKFYHSDEHVAGSLNTGEGMGWAWGFLGRLGGLSFGDAVFLIPHIGPVRMAGPLIAEIVGGLECAAMAGGVSPLGAALINIGIPKTSAIDYEVDLVAGRFALIVHGTQEETARARMILRLTAEHAIHGQKHSTRTSGDDNVRADA